MSKPRIHSHSAVLRSIVVVIIIFFSIAGIFSCRRSYHPEEKKLLVAVGIYPLAEWVHIIGGDHVSVTVLIPPDTDPYRYRLPEESAAALPACDLYFKIGRGLDDWGDEPVNNASGGKTSIVWLARDLPRISAYEPGIGHRPELIETIDPHVWLDPLAVQDMALHIAQELTRLRPEAESYFIANAERYMRDLNDLHIWISSRLQNLNHREFVGLHSSFIYFAHRYNLKLVKVIQIEQGKEPSDSWLDEVAVALNSMQHKIIIAEDNVDSAIAERLAQETASEVLFLETMGNPNDLRENTYISLMRHNTERLVSALK